MIRRTQLQFEADQLDLEIYRCISTMQYMADSFPSAAHKLRKGLADMRKARLEVRSLMHKEDIERTI